MLSHLQHSTASKQLKHTCSNAKNSAEKAAWSVHHQHKVMVLANTDTCILSKQLFNRARGVLLQQADKGTSPELSRHDHARVQPGASIKHLAASLGRLQRRRNRPAFHVVGECGSGQAAKKTTRCSPVRQQQNVSHAILMNLQHTSALEVPGRSLSRVLVKPNPG